MTRTDILAAAYDAGVEEEYNRLFSSPSFQNEYKIITGLLQHYIPSNSTVYDFGAGPGRYTEFLLKRGHRVGAVDISQRSLEALKTRVNGHYGSNLLFVDTSCATQTDRLPLESADAILMMGPLYHLTETGERMKTLNNALRLLKTGGIIVSVFMSTYPLIAEETDAIPLKMPDEHVSMVFFKGFEVEQYRCTPNCAEAHMLKAGFKTLLMGNLNGDHSCCLDVKTFDSYNLDSSYKNPDVGIDSQFVYIGKK